MSGESVSAGFCNFRAICDFGWLDLVGFGLFRSDLVAFPVG